ncbi:RidA family protein, partial [Pseudomonas aeruginosa]
MTAVRRIRAAALPDLPDASWSNALLVGEELVMSGMTAHPATRQAAERGGAGCCPAPTRLVLGR